MSAIRDLISRDELQVCYDNGNWALHSGVSGAWFRTPYSKGDWLGELPETERLVNCCLSEMGYFAFPDRWSHKDSKIGPYAVSEYARALGGVLGNVREYVEAMEEDLGCGRLEMDYEALQFSGDPSSPEFQLFLMPTGWDELYAMLFPSE